MSHTKFCFIYLNPDEHQPDDLVLVNQVYEALISRAAAVTIIHAGFKKQLALRITYVVPGPDPDYPVEDEDLDPSDLEG